MDNDFDLYEFPAGYVGRKTYVHVEGHKRSVPIVYTYRGGGRNHVHPDFGGTFDGMDVSAPMIMSDMQAYISPLDRSVVTSRSTHRDHIRKHDVIEVGNECFKGYERARDREQDRAPMQRAGHDIQRAVHELRNR